MNTSNMHILITVTAALVMIIFMAQLFGSLAIRLKQPAVVGEMIAGIILGPSVIGLLAPEFSAAIFTNETRSILYTLGMIGLCIYMFLVGVEHESPALDRHERVLPYVLGSLNFLVPVFLGAITASLVADQYRPSNIHPVLFSSFVGVAISVTAFPMLARILQAQRMMQTRFGSIAITAAAIDDVLAWCGLAIVTAVATSGNPMGALYTTILPTVLFAIISFYSCRVYLNHL